MHNRYFLNLTEYNENGQDSWNFFIQYNGNEEALDALRISLLQLELDEKYLLRSKIIPEYEVDSLVEYSPKNQMPIFNKVVGSLDILLLPLEDKLLLDKCLANGGIAKYYSGEDYYVEG